MYEGLRKNSQSLLLIVTIAFLATIFATQFNPAGGAGCSSGAAKITYVARVGGRTVDETDFRTLTRLAAGAAERYAQFFQRAPDRAVLRQAVIDGLIERELLAAEAERLGFRITDEDLNKEIRDGYFYQSFGHRQVDQLVTQDRMPFQLLAPRQRTYYGERPSDANAPSPFNYDEFEGWVHNLFNRTVPNYKKLMAREMLADRMRSLVMANVRVADDEVWRDFQRNQNNVALRYLQFSPDFYRLTVRDDVPADVEAFARAHEREINEQYAQRRESLRGLPEQVRIRQLLVRFPDGADEPARLAAQQRAEALRARIASGAVDFVRAARLYSQDESTWGTGGESAWVAADRVDLPDDVKRALPGLQPGQLSAVIRSPLGAHVVQLVGRRQGDIAEADAKRDIARELYVLTRGNELAAEAATRAQRDLAAPDATLDAVATAAHAAALRAFYHGDVPAPEHLPGNNTLEPVSHTDAGAPELRETEPFTANGSIPRIENSEPLVRAAFRLTEQNPSPAAPVAVGDERYVIRLKDRGRHVATREEFERERLRLMDEYAQPRRREALGQYITRLRAEADRAGAVKLGNSPLLRQRTDENEPGRGN